MKKTILIGFVIALALFINGCETDKCKNVSCNDDNLCTIDSCNSNTGSCLYEARTCPQGQKCNTDTGNCGALGVIDEIENAIREKLK